METVKMFVNGEAMSGGSISGGLERATFLRRTSTAPWYRFYSVRDEFPGPSAVESGGRSIVGELYETSYELLRRELLPLEPPELELGIIQLVDGTGSLAMVVRSEVLGRPDLIDISDFGDWIKYRESLQRAQ